ncbi:putative acid--thiol ligase [Helianthus annuus]|nr:putative acid--thiol ligase [Helianthus annuus]
MLSVKAQKPETPPPPPPPPLISSSSSCINNNNNNHDDSSTRVFRSKLPDLPCIPNHMPLHSYCFQNLSRFSDRPCLVVGSTGTTYSYSQTHLLSRRIAAGLSSLGVSKGDVIMLLLQNCAEFALAFIAASMIGAVTTAANPFCTAGEISKQLTSSRPRS